MLENIKLLLGLEDDKYDGLILLYIDKFTKSILAYCNIIELEPALESFIEDKIFQIMKSKVSSTEESENNGKIKSISRGDTRIEYNISTRTNSESTSIAFSDTEKKYLNTFRRVVMH